MCNYDILINAIKVKRAEFTQSAETSQLTFHENKTGF